MTIVTKDYSHSCNCNLSPENESKMPLTSDARRLIGTVLLSYMLFGSTGSAQETLVSPTPELRSLLLQKLQGNVPDFNQLALQTEAVRSADEFDEATILSREIERLQGVWRNLELTEEIEFNAQTFLGEYDENAGGFPLRLFAPGTFIQGAVPITFANASNVRIFPVAIENGREVLTKAGQSRAVTLTVRLDQLQPSALRSNAIDAHVAEVIVRDRSGSEIGSYMPQQTSPDSESSVTLSADEIAQSLSNTLEVPVAGQTWNEVTPFLQRQRVVLGTGGNFSGELFAFKDGEFRTQRPLDQYRDLTLVYGTTEQATRIAFGEATRRSFGFNGAPRPFGSLDCSTPDSEDPCGILHFERIGEDHILVDTMSVAEQADAPYTSEAALLPFDENALASMSSAETQIAFAPYELGGQGNGAVAALMYWAGDLNQGPLPLSDLRAGFSETYSAQTMLWIIDGQNDRSIYIVRSSLP